MSEILEAHGPDSFIGLLTCTLMGSTETTFYVLAVYLGAAGVVDGRHALFCRLAGDAAGFFEVRWSPATSSSASAPDD